MVRISEYLLQKAEAAIQAQKCWQEAPFSPECLTLYLHNQCNLRCLYCYATASPDAAASPHTSARLDVRTIHAAAEFVAESCYRKGCPLTIAFHGGGEPILDRGFAEQILALLDEVAQQYGVPTIRYVATNGVMSEKKAVWLARHFDLVGLSCDGPADIQNHQRPLWGGGPTAQRVEQTVRILHEEGQKVHVRATITRMNVARQVEIVAYLRDKFSPEEIHFEPMYSGGRADTAHGLGPLEAAVFVGGFMKARQKAHDYNVPLLYAGCRLHQVHGPYCNVFRDVLNLVPGGVATACFKMTDGGRARARGMVIGALDENNGRFAVDHDRVRGLRLRLAPRPPKCRDCFNQFHCAGECPEICPLNGDTPSENRSPSTAFRCQVQKALTAAILQEAADSLWSTSKTTPSPRQGENGNVYGTPIL